MLDTSPMEQPVSADTRHELLARILASEQFSRAPRLQRFLTYIVDCYIHDRLDEITEQQIGVHVFDKSADYNPGDDNVVRSYARTLRKRLEEYFAGEGAGEPFIIEVPRGKYIPVFIERAGTNETVLSRPTGVPTTEFQLRELDGGVIGAANPGSRGGARAAHGQRLWMALLLTLLPVVAVVTSLIAFRLGRSYASPKSSPAVHQFWSALQNGQSTLIVPSDTGLTIVLGLTKRDISVPDYITGAYVARDNERELLPEGWANTNVHRYTDLIDLKIVSALTQLPEMPSTKTTIRYARDLRADDLKSGNAILIGGTNANPWVQLFDQRLNFALRFVPQQRTFEIINRSPRPGEPSSYSYGPENWLQVSYGMVALRPNLAGTGYVLIIEGVAAAGLQGAAEYLFNEEKMKSLLPRIVDAKGQLRPFEILFRTSNVGANAGKTEVIGVRLD